MDVSEAVLSRRSVRAFLDTPVELEVIRRVMDQARFAPSGCNFQPWEATIVAGDKLRELQGKMAEDGMMEAPEYDWTAPNDHEQYQSRMFELAGQMFGSLGIDRNDEDGRNTFSMRNVVSFDAPALLLCHFPRYMKEPQWSDVGMWLQTVMLLLRGEGLDSCPQEFMAYYANTIRDFIGLDHDSTMFFCGLGIGYRDPDHAANNFERSRVPLDDQVKFVGF
ncbi:MAG: nitroreductase [Sphingomonadaceae bacterium]|nr:nitroreductase [Sphingomonadaceae bacterium]